jgi:hypothetical protein
MPRRAMTGPPSDDVRSRRRTGGSDRSDLMDRSDPMDRSDRTDRGRLTSWPRRFQIIGLLVLAPACAEYLSAYDDSTGDALRLIGGLVIFAPLYGAPALLIREMARRAGLGWIGIVLLAAAFGLIEAGVVDQSLFSTDYRQIEGWADGYHATLIPTIGVSAFNALNFIGGHVVFSICAPIALLEAARPRAAAQAWLGRPALAITAVAYLAASALVLQLHLTTEDSHASLTQMVVSLALIGGLIGAAFWLGRRRRPTSARSAPRLLTVLAVSLALSVLSGFAEETWTGVAMTAGAYLVAALVVVSWSRRAGWGVRRIAMLAAAPLVVRAVLAFSYDPLVGQVSEAAKYGHNAVMLVVVLLATALSLRPRARVESSV